SEYASQLDGYIGKDVYFGIRPEDLHDAQFVPPGIEGHAVFGANTNVLEPLGAEVYAYVQNGNKEFVARFDPRTQARIGQAVDVVANMQKMHIFDRETEKAII